MSRERKRHLVKMIHIGKHELGLSDEEYRSILMQSHGVRSSLELTESEASAFLDKMKSLGFILRSNRSVPGSPSPVTGYNRKPSTGNRQPLSPCWPCAPRAPRAPIPHNVVYAISHAQQSRIRHLAADITWGARFNGFQLWLNKYFKIDNGLAGILDSLTADKVIFALQNLWKTQNHCACKRAASGGL